MTMTTMIIITIISIVIVIVKILILDWVLTELLPFSVGMKVKLAFSSLALKLTADVIILVMMKVSVMTVGFGLIFILL